MVIVSIKDASHLTGHIAVARHVSIPVVPNVGTDLLVKRRKGADVKIRLCINNRHLKKSILSCFFVIS